MHSKVLHFWVFLSFNRQHLNHLRTVPIHINFFAKMVAHEIPHVLHHPLDHGPILVVLQGILLIGTWHSGKNKHNLNLSKNVTMSTLWAFIPSIIQHQNIKTNHYSWKFNILNTFSSHSSFQHPCFLSSTTILSSLMSKQKIFKAIVHHTKLTHNKHHKKFKCCWS